MVKIIATVTIVLVIFYFLLASLISNWQKIPFENLRFNIFHLIISFLFLLLNFLVFVEGWRRIIFSLGGIIKYNEAFWVMSASQTAKYVPGGIWFAIGRVYLAKSPNLKSETIAASIIIETIMTFIVGILLFLIAVAFTGQKTIISYLFIIPVLALFLMLTYPPVLNKVMNLALLILKRPAIHISIPYLRLLGLSIYFLGLWVAQIIGFFFLINSICPVSASKIFNLTAAYTLSWMSGFVVILAPSGLGVREGMMSLLLSSFITSPLAIAISFLSRIWITFFEIIILIAGIIVKKKMHAFK